MSWHLKLHYTCNDFLIWYSYKNPCYMRPWESQNVQNVVSLPSWAQVYIIFLPFFSPRWAWLPTSVLYSFKLQYPCVLPDSPFPKYYCNKLATFVPSKRNKNIHSRTFISWKNSRNVLWSNYCSLLNRSTYHYS